MTRPGCAAMCNLINTYTTYIHILPWEDQCECNLINTNTHTHTGNEEDMGGKRKNVEKKGLSRLIRGFPFVASDQVSLIPPWEDQCEWHRMTRMTGPDCAVMCNYLINTHTHRLK